MFQKEKEKRKGIPRRRWSIVLLCVAILGVLGFYVYTQMTQPHVMPIAPATLTAFDINDAQDEIALAWAYNGMNKWDIHSWSDVQKGIAWSDAEKGTARNNIMGISRTYTKSIVYQPNGSALMISFSDNTSLLYEDNDHMMQFSDIYWPEYSPSGRWLTFVCQCGTRLYDTTRPDQTYGRPDQILPVGNDPKFTAISPDDKTLATTSSTGKGKDWEDNAIDLYDIETGRKIRQIPISEGGALGPIVFSPDGTQLALGNSPQTETGLPPRVLILDLETETLRILPMPNMPFNWILSMLEYDPTGRWVAAGTVPMGFKQYQGGINVFDLASENATLEPTLLPTERRIVGFQFLSDGLVIGTEDNQLAFWRWTGVHWDHAATWSVVLEN